MKDIPDGLYTCSYGAFKVYKVIDGAVHEPKTEYEGYGVTSKPVYSWVITKISYGQSVNLTPSSEIEMALKLQAWVR